MALDANIRGITSGAGADVIGSNQLKVITETNAATNPGNVGGMRMFSENDAGDITGTPLLRSPEVSQDFRMRVGVDTLLFADSFNSVTQNTSLWKHSFATMTMTQASGLLNVNAAGTSTASGNYAYLQTWRYFTFFGTAPISVECTALIDKYPISNEILQWGLGVTTGAADPIDGVWFQLTSAGLFGVLRYNSGTPVAVTLVSNVSTLALNSFAKYVMVVGEDSVEFWIDDVLYGSLAIPNAQGQPFLTTSLPFFIQKFNNALVGSSPNLIAKFGDVAITLMDLASNMTWANQMASIGLGMQLLNGDAAATQTPQVQWANAALPTAAAATNTSAALGAFLSGIFLQTTVGTGVTDLIIASYQNPLGSVNRTPRTIKIRGIKVDCVLSGAALATTPSTFALAVVWGSTQISLGTVTADSASFANNTAKGARRQPIGVITFPAAAAVGTAATTVQFDFEAPLVINPGEFIQIVQKPIVATATVGNIYNWVVSPNLYHE